MKYIHASGMEVVEVRLPNDRLATIMSSATCLSAIESLCLHWYEYEPIGAYLVNEKGVMFSNCKLHECEGDLYLVCRRKFKQKRPKSRKPAKLKGRSWPWEFFYSETARNTDYNSQRNILLRMLWFLRKPQPPSMMHNQLHASSITKKSVTFGSLDV